MFKSLGGERRVGHRDVRRVNGDRPKAVVGQLEFALADDRRQRCDELLECPDVDDRLEGR